MVFRASIGETRLSFQCVSIYRSELTITSVFFLADIGDCVQIQKLGCKPVFAY